MGGKSFSEFCHLRSAMPPSPYSPARLGRAADQQLQHLQSPLGRSARRSGSTDAE